MAIVEKEFGEKLGKNGSIYTFMEDGILNIQIDTNKEIGPSASGKSTLIASSGGNAEVNIGSPESGDRKVKLGLNLFY